MAAPDRSPQEEPVLKKLIVVIAVVALGGLVAKKVTGK